MTLLLQKGNCLARIRGRIADKEFLGIGKGQPAGLKVFPRGGALIRHEGIAIEGIQIGNAVHQFPFFGVDCHLDSLGQSRVVEPDNLRGFPYCLDKRTFFVFLDETDGVSTMPADETLIDLKFDIDGKRGIVVIVKWANGRVILSFFNKAIREVMPHDVHDVRGLKKPVNHFAFEHNPPFLLYKVYNF